jgi:SagB-type dehydrogenase family enzyme
VHPTLLGTIGLIWRKYHQATKHTPELLRQNRHFLDWANMPDPFRHYEGVPVIDLPGDPKLGRAPGWIDFLSGLLFYSASISATKQTSSGQRYALRVNPSSGNLHPTEFHLACPNGLYHYRVSSHMLEQRAAGDYGTLRLLLTTVAWREAWKYQSRAYRYCLLDIGHAWQSLALAAQALGCETSAVGNFDDDELARSWGLADDEWPMLEVEIYGAPEFPAGGSREWFGGVANKLSTEVIRYPLIDEIETATRNIRTGWQAKAPAPLYGEIARRRRSALDFRGGDESISYGQLLNLLELAMHADGYIELYLYVHRVRDLARGLYRYWAGEARLELLKSGDQRVMAAALSLGQNLAGNSCVTFSMIGDLERAAETHGDRGYRYVHFQAGAIGQRLYLAAESLGFQSTGIGAFFDDTVHDYLGIPRASGRQVVYHFACGYAVEDERIVSPC